MLSSLFKYAFLQNAFLASILASIACGIIGTIIIEKKLVMMSGGIAHTSFGGVGMGYFLKIEPIIGALAFSVGAALGITAINKRARTNPDVIMGIFWSVGMAVGILFIAFTPGYPPEMSSYLFGDILAVSRMDLAFMLFLDLLVLLVVIALFNQLKAYLFDEEFSSVLKVSTTFLEYLIFILVAFTVVVLIRVVGIILAIALLTAPPAIVKMFTYNLKKIMLWSAVLGMFFCFAGLWISYELHIASGASIILLAGLAYIFAAFAKKLNSAKPAGKNSYVLFIIIYATMFLFGLIENIKGVSFPLIKAEFNVAYGDQGGLVSVTWFGYVAFCLIASLFLQRFGIKKSILAGYILICIGAIATLTAPSFWAVSLTLLIVNTGFGFFEVGSNALGTAIFTKRSALMMRLAHFFYGFGAILGPKTAGALTNTFGFTWRQVYIAVIIPAAIVFLFILFTKFKGEADGKNSQGVTAKATFIGALKNPIVWLFSITLGFMEVVEFGAANWGGLYLQDVYGLDPRVIGASFVSLFYVLFTLSRLFSGLAIEKIGYLRSLYLAAGGTIILFLAGFILGRAGIWILPFTGLFIAIMWPTVMAVAMQVFGGDAPTITSAVITISGAINGIFQMVIGLTNHYIGVAWGYRSCLLYAIILLIILAFLSARIKTIAQKQLPTSS